MLAIIKNYFVALACMLALASVSSVSERQIIASAADAIGGESGEELECMICMAKFEDEELVICPGSGCIPHAFHWGCLRRSKAKDENHKKTCPGCTKNWETQLIDIRARIAKNILVNCSRFKDSPESVDKFLRRAPSAAELKEILLQMVDNFEELSQIHKQFQDICRRLLEDYAYLSRIYDGSSGESALEKTISEMDDVFEELKEDKIRSLSLSFANL